MEEINVLVVDDSAFMRQLITSLLGQDPRIRIVGTARNGKECLEKIKLLQPDCVILDIEMPVLNGLETLKIIMEQSPLPVIIFSSTTKEGAENTFLAFQYGAYDFIAKPAGQHPDEITKVKNELIEKVLASQRANISGLQTRNVQGSIFIEKQEKDDLSAKRNKIVFIGTSTGGPRALQEVIPKLPEDLEAPVLIVQHMPAGFTKSLAERLDSFSRLRVKEAENGEILQNGTVYIAPGGFHLKVRRVGFSLAAQLDQSPPVFGHRPSVDVLLSSACSLTDYKKMVVIMTGMGADGAKGLAALKKTGNVVALAESEKTAVIYGMPRAAVATGCVDEVVDLDLIAERIVKKL
ncbi:protein-glutamate methylesterase/protein-glutamine glutaminase [Caldibacillus debilis]|jgi:two-component system chemotaxis response regulator CheB|uniref:Protein-glutamate methylesterase/protein-glutamine glutaminase n=1 Tax=Caldibacillus debilis GB1 TaxID=1339248 RepID=A0A420VBM8_9BACI|nr:chemotaxis response regulator protein-glutamate methylesterase [Caldibacillus debilis]RKO60936.1 Chemotaxis response regulator containing a CheY-like receiver domain and a methylesterase domain [Caldibacillus debilis GB1]